MKARTLLLMIMCYLLVDEIAFSQQGWVQVTNPQSPLPLYGVYFKDINTGVVSNYKTTNSGLNWTQTDANTGNSMCFLNSLTGYRASTVITKTTNLGDNWMLQTNPANALYGISFTDINTGYACGSFGKIIKTTNSGNNWTQIFSPVPNDYVLVGIHFRNAVTGYFVGYKLFTFESVFIRTTNGCSTYTVQNFQASTTFAAIYFIDDNTGFIGGKGVIYKTINAGTSWSLLTSPTINQLSSIYFPDAVVGYMSGYSGTIIKTTNGGSSWFQQTSTTNLDLKSVYFINENSGFICGNSVVLRTTDGGGPPIGIKPTGSPVPDKFELFQNYPNPFNPTTKIKFDVATPPQPSPKERESGIVRLVIYDVLGREVAVLVNEKLSPGTYEVEFDATNYPSGVYLYILTAQNFSMTRKLVLLK